MTRSTKAWIALAAVVGVLIVTVLLLRSGDRREAAAAVPRLAPPAFDSTGPPRVALKNLPHQWQRLPLIRRETGFRWEKGQEKPTPINRVVLPFDSRVESNPVRYLFRNILKSPDLKTGILLDACASPVPRETDRNTPAQDGPADLTTLTAKARLLSTCADPSRNPFAGFDRIIREARRYYREHGVLPLVIVDVDTERLRPEARDKLAISQAGMLEVPVDERTFERTNVFAVAPLERQLGYRRVKVIVDSRFIITNRKKPDFYSISVNGQPSVRKRLGSAFLVEFAKAGQTATIAFALGRTGGLSSAVQMALQSTLVPNYDLNWVSSCHPVGPNGEDVWIRPYVFYGTNHNRAAGQPEIQNPFVILGGYDQELFGNYSRMYAAVAALTPGSDFIGQLRNQFDVVLLEYADVGVSLELNAQALACVILDINQRNQNRDGIVFVGISMGGLVSRMTFAGMEKDAIPGIDGDHRVRFWATIDTPHQGAHVPLGLQFLADKFSWIPVDEIDRVNGLLNSTAAREMLIEHHETPDAVSPERRNHLSTLSGWGSFPRNIRTTLGMASGSLAYLWWNGGSRVVQAHHYVPFDCPEGRQCAGYMSEFWQRHADNIRLVRSDQKVHYDPQDNRNGLGGLELLSVYMHLNFEGLRGTLVLDAADRAIQDRRVSHYHAGQGDPSETTVFRSGWELDVLPGWVLAFVDNPSGESRADLRYGNPYSVMAGGWLSTPQDIFDALGKAEIGVVSGPYPYLENVSGATMPRHTFVPLWSALDIPEPYLTAMYNYLTRYAAQLTWETWYGSNLFPGNALNRGQFSYEDFVDFDRLLWFLSRPGFDGRVQPTTLRSGSISEDPVTGQPSVESVTVRASPFGWIYFNKNNERHGQIDAAGIQFLLDRIQEELTGSAAGAGGGAPVPAHYTVAVMPAAQITPDAMLQRAITFVEGTGLPSATEATFTSRLQTALQQVQSGNNQAAITSLEAFIADVESERGRNLTDQQADDLIQGANGIIALLM